MKNRVYKIKDKILVRGNENELTKDEVLVKEENGSVVLKERVNGEVKDIVVKGGGSYSNNIKYYDISQLDENQQTAILSYSILCKMIGDNVNYGVQLLSPMMFYMYAKDFSTLKYVAVDFSIKVSRYVSSEEGVTQQELITVGEIFNQLSTAYGIELPEITEEEFYAIPE